MTSANSSTRASACLCKDLRCSARTSYLPLNWLTTSAESTHTRVRVTPRESASSGPLMGLPDTPLADGLKERAHNEFPKADVRPLRIATWACALLQRSAVSSIWDFSPFLMGGRVGLHFGCTPGWRKGCRSFNPCDLVISRGGSRAGGTRTPDHRFWRPLHHNPATCGNPLKSGYDLPLVRHD